MYPFTLVDTHAEIAGEYRGVGMEKCVARSFSH